MDNFTEEFKARFPEEFSDFANFVDDFNGRTAVEFAKKKLNQSSSIDWILQKYPGRSTAMIQALGNHSRRRAAKMQGESNGNG